MVTLDGRMAFFDIPAAPKRVPLKDVCGSLQVVKCPGVNEVANDIATWLARIDRSGDTMSHVCGLVAIAFQDDGPAS